MQRFDRTTEPPPIALQGDAASQARRVLSDFMRYGDERLSQTNVPRSELPLEDVSIREALNRLFRGRCAFCESRDKISPYRFRPATEAVPSSTPRQAHLYYAWLEHAWENMYTICSSCRPSEPNYFPVSGPRVRLPTPEELDRYAEENLGLWRAYPIREKAVFLDPCGEGDFSKHLWPQTNGSLIGISTRGEATIENFNLNAPERVVARRERYAEYFARFSKCLTDPESIARAPGMFEFPEFEFGGSWYLLLRRLALLMGPEFGGRPIVSQARIKRFYMAMLGKPDTANRLRQGWGRLVQEDHNYEAAPAITRRPSKVRVTSVGLRNFKAIEDLSIALPSPSQGDESFDAIHPAPSLLIIGENSAGKSSILEAIALAISDEAARKKLALKPGNFVLNPTYMGAVNFAAVERAEVQVSLSNGASRILTIDREGMKDHSDPGSELIPVFAYGAFRQYQHKQRPRSPDKYIRNLFDGSVLSNPEKWLLSLQPSAYAMVMRALREILSIEGEFEVVQRDMEEKRCYMITAAAGTHGEPRFVRTPLGAVSSGFRSVLAMACDVMQGLMDPDVYAGFESLSTARGVILIDEVEAHLHPRWKMQIMRGLRRALPQMTFIATTHDPLCLRGMEDGEVVVLQRVLAEDSQSATDLPVFVERLENLPHVSELRIEQLLTSDFFQLHSTDAPEMEVQLAQIGDLLAKDPRDLSPTEGTTVDKFRRDVAAALPIGASEAHRLVQEAVAEYLMERRAVSERRMKELKQTAKSRIVEALRGI